jgi:hypothetical protein
MAQMNKQVSSAVNPRRAQLEMELISREVADQMTLDVETGHASSVENQKKMRPYIDKNKHFLTKQGLRRRHPVRTLNQYAGVHKTTSGATQNWEQAMLYENERVEMPKDFNVDGMDAGMTNQMGVATIALDNYKKSKEKLLRMHLVGV